MGPRSNYKIAKINHKTRLAHTGVTIKLARRLANRRIFLAFTTNHVAALRKRRMLLFTLPSRATECILSREENCPTILQRYSKRRCKMSNSLPSLLVFLLISTDPFALCKCESVLLERTREFTLNHVLYIISQSNCLKYFPR